jgi:sugar phosphate permease
VLGAEWIGLIVALLPWGLAVDRFGERWTLAAGMLGCAAFLTAAAFADDFVTLVILIALAGGAGASVQSGSGRAIMNWFGREERGLALDTRGFSRGAAAAVLVVIQLAGVVTRIAVGRWSDRRGARLGPLRAICAALAIACGVLALVEPLPDGVVVPALLAAAFLSVSWNGLSFATVAELAQRGASGTALGLQNTLLAIAGTACLATFGALVDATSWRAGFVLLALLPLASLSLLPRARA